MSPAIRRWLLRALQLAVVAFVLWRASRDISNQWVAFRARGGTIDPHWGLVAASSALVVAVYLLLVQSWRSLVGSWGRPLAFGDAVRIWSVSNLGRYLPGKVWSIAAMAALSRQAGISPVAATGSAILGTLVSLAAGFAVVLVAGERVLRTVAPGNERAGLAVAAVVTAGLLAFPLLLPTAARLAARLLRRDLALPPVAARRLWGVVLANLTAWVGYGIAFRLLAMACLPTLELGSAGDWGAYVAVFTASYLAGYLALVIPGGLGVRELALVAGLTGLGLMGTAESWVLALASRLWLTVLEILPGLLFLARDAALRSPSTTPDVPS